MAGDRGRAPPRRSGDSRASSSCASSTAPAAPADAGTRRRCAGRRRRAPRPARRARAAGAAAGRTCPPRRPSRRPRCPWRSPRPRRRPLPRSACPRSVATTQAAGAAAAHECDGRGEVGPVTGGDQDRVRRRGPAASSTPRRRASCASSRTPMRPRPWRSRSISAWVAPASSGAKRRSRTPSAPARAAPRWHPDVRRARRREDDEVERVQRHSRRQRGRASCSLTSNKSHRFTSRPGLVLANDDGHAQRIVARPPPRACGDARLRPCRRQAGVFSSRSAEVKGGCE